MPPGAIVVGAHANGLGVIRALAARGVPAVSISTRPFDVAQHSRWVHERHALPSLHQQHESLVELLDRHAARWRGWAVVSDQRRRADGVIAAPRALSRVVPPGVSALGPSPLRSWTRIRCTTWPWHRGSTCQCVRRGDTGHGGPPGLRYPADRQARRHDHLISTFGVKLFVASDAASLARGDRPTRERGARRARLRVHPRR